MIQCYLAKNDRKMISHPVADAEIFPGVGTFCWWRSVWGGGGHKQKLVGLGGNKQIFFVVKP